MEMSLEDRLKRMAHVAAHAFRINTFTELFIVEHIEGNAYGTYDDETGFIELRVTNTRTGGQLALQTIIDTLAHELAHAVEFNHGSEHRKLTSAIKLFINRNWDFI